MLTPADISTRYRVAAAAAREAGLLARRRFLDRAGMKVSFKGHQDFLTETDGEVERMLVGMLRESFPDDQFVGEEGGGVAGAATWVIDPIDGTANFARGLPHFCVSVGFVLDGRPELGVIAAPMQDELYCARRGQGASVNGEPIRAASTDDLGHAIVEIGWSPRLPASVYVDTIATTFGLGASVRRGGSGALGLAYVAAGRIDAYVERHINSWDVAAGLVLVAEAGGRMNDFWAGDGMRKGNPVIAAAPGIATPLSDALALPLI